jgi:hypothetical protein
MAFDRPAYMREYRRTHPRTVAAGRPSRAGQRTAVDNQRDREYRDDIRAAVLDHYGWECACCRAEDRLTIDHIDGGGELHRLEIGRRSTAIYLWLIKNGYPPGFQTLCMPCNQSKAGTDRCRLSH